MRARRNTSKQRLAGARVAVVTGAGRGIGRAAAEAFAANDYTVVVAERAAGPGRRAARALTESGGRAIFLPCDVADPASVDETVRTVVTRFGRIDCLVNNAGVLTPGGLVRLALRDVDRMLTVNLRGPILFSRAVLPVMLRQRSGAIVNVGSQLGKIGIADYAVYCASKFGVVGFTEALADELAGTGIRAWAVCPGLVDTAMAGQAGVSARERRGLIRPETVAAVIRDLAIGRRQAKSGAAVDVTS